MKNAWNKLTEFLKKLFQGDEGKNTTKRTLALGSGGLWLLLHANGAVIALLVGQLESEWWVKAAEINQNIADSMNDVVWVVFSCYFGVELVRNSRFGRDPK